MPRTGSQSYGGGFSGDEILGSTELNVIGAHAVGSQLILEGSKAGAGEIVIPAGEVVIANGYELGKWNPLTGGIVIVSPAADWSHTATSRHMFSVVDTHVSYVFDLGLTMAAGFVDGSEIVFSVPGLPHPASADVCNVCAIYHDNELAWEFGMVETHGVVEVTSRVKITGSFYASQAFRIRGTLIYETL